MVLSWSWILFHRLKYLTQLNKLDNCTHVICNFSFLFLYISSMSKTPKFQNLCAKVRHWKYMNYLVVILPHSTKDYDNTCPICNYKAWWFVVFQYEITTYDSKRFIYHIHFRNINNIQQRCHIIHMNFFMMFHLMGSTLIVWRVI